MIAARRIIFFIISSLIITLFIWWGFDGFELFTKIYPPTELLDEQTGVTFVQSKGSFTLGLDMVIVISIGLSAVGIVIINFLKVWFASREDK